MASFLDNAAAAIAAAAGWKRPSADEGGAYGFSLQGDLNMRMFSPDGGNTVIFCSVVQTLPEDGRSRGDVLLAHAQRAVAAGKERKTTLALEGDTLILHKVIQSKGTTLEELPGIAESFLNDLDWWKAQAARLAV